MTNERLFQRFKDIGRFVAEDICALPGVLENISQDGCKIHYSLPVELEMEKDYEAKIIFARAANEQFNLLFHPQWLKKEGDNTDIGFKILPSTDYSKLAQYIKKLDSDSNDSISDEISGLSCQMI